MGENTKIKNILGELTDKLPEYANNYSTDLRGERDYESTLFRFEQEVQNAIKGIADVLKI